MGIQRGREAEIHQDRDTYTQSNNTGQGRTGPGRARKGRGEIHTHQSGQRGG